MPYREVSGSIFNSRADALVNTVNCVGVMGKGIALEFRRRFPIMFMEYERVCMNGMLKPGQILPYRREKPWVLNLAIKNHWRQPSKIEWVRSCLQKFVINYEKMEINSVAFPWMGAMNGGIPIEDIKKITRDYLSNLPIDIEVYDFDPDASDPLFEKLTKIAILKKRNVQDLHEASGIQPRYLDRALAAIREGKVKSMPRLIDSGLLGKTNTEKLYAFLVSDVYENEEYHQLTLFDKRA